jgi:uncharacterized membrane protein
VPPLPARGHPCRRSTLAAGMLLWGANDTVARHWAAAGPCRAIFSAVRASRRRLLPGWHRSRRPARQRHRLSPGASRSRCRAVCKGLGRSKCLGYSRASRGSCAANAVSGGSCSAASSVTHSAPGSLNPQPGAACNVTAPLMNRRPPHCPDADPCKAIRLSETSTQHLAVPLLLFLRCPTRFQLACKSPHCTADQC